MRILVIEDEKDICDMLGYFFKKENIDAVFCTTVKIGIQQLREEKFDLVLLDLAMPDYSGYDFLDKIKEQAMNQTKIIVYTAVPISEEEKTMIKKRGAIECIKKTSDLAHLKEILLRVTQSF